MENLSNKVDNNPTSPAGLLPASEWNPFVSEFLNVLLAASITPDENSEVQMLEAIRFLVDEGLKSVGLKVDSLPFVPEISSVPQIDGINKSGFYAVRAGAISGAGGNLPSNWGPAVGQGMLLHFASGGMGITQSQLMLKSGFFWMRFETATNGSWATWEEISSINDVIAYVSQFGLGTTAVSFNAGGNGKTLTTTRFTKWDSTDVDAPFGQAASGVNIQYSSTEKMQVAVTFSGELVFQRVTGTTSSGWRRATPAPAAPTPLTGQAIQYTSTTSVTFPSDVYGSTDTFSDSIFMPSGQVVDLSTTGLNGLDTGSVAANTWYHLFILKNPTTGDCKPIATVTPAGPTVIPSGYTQKLNCHMPFRTRVGSANIARFRMFRSSGLTQYWITDNELGSTDAIVFQNITAETEVDMSKCIPTGETGNSATARIYIDIISDINNVFPTDNRMVYRPTINDDYIPIIKLIGNDNVQFSAVVDELLINPANRTTRVLRQAIFNPSHQAYALGYTLRR